ncbi:MAG: MFS transporter [Acidobacteriaceae bacterium]|nr:MFS transporter [Acidobacteriaceae bacterium]
MLVSNWLSRIPAVQEQLHLSVSVLGVALLGSAGGALTAMSLISSVIRRFGSDRTTRWTSLIFCIVLPLPALSSNALTLTLFLFVYGALAGSMDVSMNTQAVDLERGYGRPIMVGFHALFSFGGMLGAATGGLAAAQHISPRSHLLLAASALLIATLFATRNLLGVDKEPLPGAHQRAPFRPLAGLAIIAFCVLLGEGAMADWTAVYLSRFTSQARAASGYATFSIMMALGRLSGDWLRARFGSVAMVRYGCAISTAGLGLGLLLGGMIPGLIGFACAGAGWAAIFPITCGAAGHKMAAQPEAGVALVTATGFFAFLVGPPLIGFLAQATSLRSALAVVVLLSAVSAALAGVVRGADLQSTKAQA